MSAPYLWPIKQHELILTAALLKDNRAIDAWQQWQQQVNTDQLDLAMSQMLPLLYRNLTALGITEPTLTRYKIIYQRNWVKNQELFQRVLPLLHALHNAGINTWLLKGAALSLQCYQDQGVRVMTDCDLLVSPQDTQATIKIMRELNWQPNFESLQSLDKAYFTIRHAHSFRYMQSNNKVDLHWRVFYESQNHEDACLIERSMPLDFYGAATRTLDFSGHLFHACVHGASENVGKKVQWAADAMSIIHKANAAIDWQFITAFAAKTQLSLPLYDALSYLYERLDAPIPASALTALKQIPTKRIIRNEYQYKTHPQALSFLGAVRRSWHQHSRLTGFRSLGYRLLTYPKFLQLTWGIPSLWRLPIAGYLTLLRRFVLNK